MPGADDYTIAFCQDAPGGGAMCTYYYYYHYYCYYYYYGDRTVLARWSGNLPGQPLRPVSEVDIYR